MLLTMLIFSALVLAWGSPLLGWVAYLVAGSLRRLVPERDPARVVAARASVRGRRLA